MIRQLEWLPLKKFFNVYIFSLLRSDFGLGGVPARLAKRYKFENTSQIAFPNSVECGSCRVAGSEREGKRLMVVEFRNNEKTTRKIK